MDNNFKVVKFFLLVSLPSVVFGLGLVSENYDAMVFGVVLISMAGIIISSAVSRVSSVFIILFSLFYVVPILIFGTKFLFEGTFYTFSLSNNEVKDMVSYLYLFLWFYCIFNIVVRKVNKSNISLSPVKEIDRVIHLVLIMSGVFIIIFNIREAAYVWSTSYSMLLSGEAGFSKNILEFFVEILFLASVFINLQRRSRVAIALYAMYLITGMLSGQRIPGFMSLAVLFIFLRPSMFGKISHITYVFLAVLIFVPALQAIAALRQGGLELLYSFDYIGAYSDVWKVVGFSFDTIKAVFHFDGKFEVSVSPFAKLNHIFYVFFDRVLGLSDAFPIVKGFGSEFAKVLDPSGYYLKSITFASSSAAESYYFFGFLGAPIYAAFVVLWTRFFDWSIIKNSFLSIAALFIFLPKFLGSVRNELFGWVWEGLIIFSCVLAIYYFFIRVFFKQPPLRRDQLN